MLQFSKQCRRRELLQLGDAIAAARSPHLEPGDQKQQTDAIARALRKLEG